MDKEIYKILDVDFVLNDDLDLDESLEASRMLRIFFIPESGPVIAETTGEEIKKFLQIALTPVNGKPVPEDFNYGKAKESVQVKIFMDFFLARIRRGMDTTNEFAELMKRRLMPSEN
jgi:hypothetical protein